ncbi:polymorphic toxin-type HINT domain-containing protein [Streptomyces collinus]|uniref:polymorphic toxin-type HINT domain-containing protein n=1 Tax=Streptomyces collinus TaxID=42684 RepID=UPI0033BB0E29
MAHGKTKAIGKIKKGDKVAAADPATGRHKGNRTVQHVWINHDYDLVDLRIRLADGTTATLHTTSKHPFWDDTRHAWVPAGKLTPGHALNTAADRHVHVTAVTPRPGDRDMYNLTVKQLHTFYVLAGSTPILVHNSNGELCATSALKGDEPGTADRLRADPQFTGGDLHGYVDTNAPGYVDSYGRTYDAVGGPTAWARGNMQQMLGSIRSHIYHKTGMNFTVLDLTGASSGQIDTVFEHLDTWDADPGLKATSKLLILGDSY